jgi:GLPGLI family protein
MYHMKNSLLVYTILISFCLFTFSCGPKANPKFISEGIIEFKVACVDPDSPMSSLAPTKMQVKFKDGFTMAEMSAGMGLFSISFISNPEKKTFINMVKMISQKFAVVENNEAIAKETDADPKPIIEKTSETKLIAGYTCKRAKVTFADNKTKPFDVWYTNELNIKDPNWTNPYKEIDGVLMEYQLKKYHLELRFNCTSVSKASIDESIFQLPSDYKIITPQEMEKKFEGF